MTTRQAIFIGALIVIGFSQAGCASFGRKVKAFLGGNSTSVAESEKAALSTKFSSSGDIVPRVRRQYKRTTKETLAEESGLDQNAGSLWVMEGQGAYLFSQNIVRMIGDPIGVVIEGEPREQLQGKVDVIRNLLAKFEERQRARLRAPASEAESKTEKAMGKDEKSTDAKAAATAAGGAAEAPAAKPLEPMELGIKTVPTRITERTADGNYRVKGVQPFMIGTREYKVIVTGVVRAEDFDEGGISAAKLIDPKFDIVSARRKEDL